MEGKLKTIEANNSFFGTQLRANNVVTYNLPEEEKHYTDLFAITFDIFKKNNIPIPEYAVNDIFRMGKKSENHTHPVLIKFTGTRWVKIIFSNMKCFKSLNLGITYDYSKEERQERKILKDKI